MNRHDATRSDRSMGNVNHTHPFADRGTVNRPFQRGPVVAADGGERNAASRTSDDDEQGETTDEATEAVRHANESTRMKDVDHTPPHSEGESVNRVFARGDEQPARDEPQPGDLERGAREEPVDREE